MVFTGVDHDKCTDVVFTHDDILNVWKRVRPDKAGVDDITPRLLEQIESRCVTHFT